MCKHREVKPFLAAKVITDQRLIDARGFCNPAKAGGAKAIARKTRDRGFDQGIAGGVPRRAGLISDAITVSLLDRSTHSRASSQPPQQREARHEQTREIQGSARFRANFPPASLSVLSWSLDQPRDRSQYLCGFQRGRFESFDARVAGIHVEPEARKWGCDSGVRAYYPRCHPPSHRPVPRACATTSTGTKPLLMTRRTANRRLSSRSTKRSAGIRLAQHPAPTRPSARRTSPSRAVSGPNRRQDHATRAFRRPNWPSRVHS